MRLALGAQAKLASLMWSNPNPNPNPNPDPNLNPNPNPNPNQVAMLRNPADRFYSAYNMGMNEVLRRSGGFGLGRGFG